MKWNNFDNIEISYKRTIVNTQYSQETQDDEDDIEVTQSLAWSSKLNPL